jgi:hypothetical protein
LSARLNQNGPEMILSFHIAFVPEKEDQQTNQPMSQADRDALFEKLFQEFLRWKDGHTTKP